VSRRVRRVGCLLFGIAWASLIFCTVALFALGDCERDPNTGNCLNQPVNFERIVFGSELLLLVVVGWIFYRREMKDDGF
jgi:hypothetical protein